MILQALYHLYQRLLDEPESGISPPGYSTARVSFALNLSKTGELLDLIDLRVADKAGKEGKPLARDMVVPRKVKRSSGVSANFLCDNSGYVLGVDAKGKPDRTRETFRAFRAIHQEVLGALDDPGATAVLTFLERWNPDLAADCEVLKPLWNDLLAGGDIVFRLDGTSGFVHDRPAIRAAWEQRSRDKQSDVIGQCLVTGEFGPIAGLHDNVKGVVGAQPTGAAIVSFNLPAFESYGKTQGLNAPVSETAAFSYVTALNFLLRSDRHRLRIGDATTVFWAERSAKLEEDMLAELMDPIGADTGRGIAGESEARETASTYRRDPQATRLAHDVLLRVSQGQPARVDMAQVDPDVRFYILGLAPNISRLSVRFMHVDTFGGLIDRIAQHYADMAVDLPAWEANGFFPVWQLIRETAPLRDSRRASPLLAGALTRAVLQGTDYPEGLYTAMLSRIRADQEVNAIRAGMIKARLIRRARIHGDSEREGMITVSLNEQCADTAYLLGRLFALLEKAQQDATPGLNATIRDRYFGAASATPQAVFPVLLRLAQHHIAKAEYGGLLDKRIEGVVAAINAFPAHLNLEQQGMFVLGYYHQRQAFYQKKTA
ncbi:MAG: type I-C CRISPR-associated protein Cas8c/Csd1 [Chloroflexota bacterium]